jgi:hypothetical protein
MIDLRSTQFYKNHLNNQQIQQVYGQVTQQIENIGVTKGIVDKVREFFVYLWDSSIVVKVVALAAGIVFLAIVGVFPASLPVTSYAADIMVASSAVLSAVDVVNSFYLAA